MRSDRVTLTVPSSGEFAKTVRLTAAELASRLDMSIDQVDDVRLAAEEAFVFACERLGCADEVTFTLELTDDMLSIAVGPLPDSCPAPQADVQESYAEFILRSVCDEFVLEHSESTCTLRLVKRVSEGEDADRA
jgi:serine/threonine-protein kinase RsbW